MATLGALLGALEKFWIFYYVLQTVLTEDDDDDEDDNAIVNNWNADTIDSYQTFEVLN